MVIGTVSPASSSYTTCSESLLMRLTNLWSWLGGPRRAQAGRTKKTRAKAPFVPAVSALEERTVMNGYLAIGAGAGAQPLVAIRVDKINALDQGGIFNVPNAGGQPLAPT